jgi:hypothetical protein
MEFLSKEVDGALTAQKKRGETIIQITRSIQLVIPLDVDQGGENVEEHLSS